MTKQANKKRNPGADVRPLRQIEKEMVAKGYASSRMVAQKVGLTFQTVLRQVRDGGLEGVTIGQQVWIPIKAVQDKYEDAFEVLGLDDWSFPDGLTGGLE